MGGAIQNLVAARLARGFVPLAGLFVAGIVGLLGGRPLAIVVAAGSVATAAAMLAYGLAVVDSVSGRVGGVRKAMVTACSVVPPVYGIFIAGWPGLQALTSASGWVAVLLATLYTVVGVWVLRSWLRVVEVRRLARSMVLPNDVPGDSA